MRKSDTRVYARILNGFRPLAGLSCINQVTLNDFLWFDYDDSFRPLAGLSCINPVLTLEEWGTTTGFRPLAELSCINHNNRNRLCVQQRLKFPSPRGVELYKPRLHCVRYVECYAVSVPSRG